MRVLVTGGCGFIGSHLVEALVREGHRVTVLDNLSTGSSQNLRAVLGDVISIIGDIRNPDMIKRAFDKQEAVMHLAALRSIQPSLHDPITYASVNIFGTASILEAARLFGVRRFLLASSSSVYGDAPAPQWSEALPTRPLSPYAATKAAAEQLVMMYHRAFRLETVALRYFNVYGPRQSDAAIPTFITAALRNQPITVYGTGQQTRYFTYISDVVEATMRALVSTSVVGEIMNIHGVRPYTLHEVLEEISRYMNDPLELVNAPAREGEIVQTGGGIRKADLLMDWLPRMPLDEGLRATVEWFRSMEPVHA